MQIDRMRDEALRQDFIRSLEEARDDLRANGPASSADVQTMLDELHAEWEQDAALERCLRPHSTPVE